MDDLGTRPPNAGAPPKPHARASHPRADPSFFDRLAVESAHAEEEIPPQPAVGDAERAATARQPLVPSSRSRFRALRRLLVRTDVTAGLVTGGLIALAAGTTALQTLVLIVTMGLLWPSIGAAAGLYAVDDLRSWASGITESPTLLLICVAVSWPVFFLLGAMSAPNPSGGALSSAVGLAAISSVGRAVARAHIHRRRELRDRTLIVGSGQVAQRLVRRVKEHDELGLTPIGFVDDDAHSHGAFGLPHLGGLAELEALLRLHRVDRVMVAFSRAGHEELLGCIRTCRDLGVPVDVVPRLFELLDGARKVDQIGGLPLLSLETPSFSRGARTAKRALDLVAAGAVLLLAAPLLALIAALIKLESPGPVLFTQSRVGRRGQVFRLLKFRSMGVGADAHKEVLLDENDIADGVMFKIHADPRVTRVGRVLRRLSLDELPQLLNVVRGDMSLVGPRPLVIPEAQALGAGWQARRVDLRPGLTGPWQVAGRSDIPFDEMITFDYLYVSGWSLARDIEILLATVPAVLSGRGAY
jgi:exopolysaccharide biosynthesis polyprenyl glycosylphosphotransferase